MKTLTIYFLYVQFAVGIPIVIRDQSIILTIHERGGDHKVRRRAIARNRDIPYDRHPQKRLYIGVVRLWFQRVPEENKEVNFVLDDLGPDLLIASQRSTFKSDDLEAQYLFQDFPCRACCKYFVMSQEIAIELCPFH